MALSSTENVCREKRLLICCARTRLPAALAEEIHALAAGPIDWDFLFREAAENSIVPLLGRQLPAAAADVVPPAQLNRLTDLVRAIAMRNLVMTAELLTILNGLRKQEVEGIPYKGPVLAAQAYGDVALREFEDLDIVIRQRDMAKANEVMLALGYRPKFPWVLSLGTTASLVPGEYNYRDEARRLIVDVHTERTLRHFPVPPDLDDLAKRLVSVSLSGHQVRTLAPEDGLPMLCIHGSKDFWERISWVADIAELVLAYPQLDWDQVFRRAESLHAQRMLRIGLALAIKLFDPLLPEEVALRVKKDRVADAVASESQERLLAREWPPLTGIGRFRFRKRTVDGAFAGLSYSMRLAIVPAEEDWQMTNLPLSLAPLYLVLRPFRLLRRYGLSGPSSRGSA